MSLLNNIKGGIGILHFDNFFRGDEREVRVGDDSSNRHL